jgi:hypothetical protein
MAVAALREISPTPSDALELVAWFEEGTHETIPFDSLVTADRQDWISTDAAAELEASMFPATMRERMTAMIRRDPRADYWEFLVLRYAEALLAIVDEDLRGIPVERAGIEPWNVEDWENLPDGLEFVDGRPSPKHWMIAVEARRRLGFNDSYDAMKWIEGKTVDEVRAEYSRRRAELRARPFVPSRVPFPSGAKE